MFTRQPATEGGDPTARQSVGQGSKQTLTAAARPELVRGGTSGALVGCRAGVTVGRAVNADAAHVHCLAGAARHCKVEPGGTEKKG